MKKDIATIRKHVLNSPLTDQELIHLWGMNEHWNLHAILFGNPKVYNVVHITSLNDKAGDGTPHGKLGGYNDKGQYPQWGWREQVGGYNALLGIK
jgi:hypothetical protein